MLPLPLASNAIAPEAVYPPATVAVQVRVSAVALVTRQLKVKFCPAVIKAGVRVTLTVGEGGGSGGAGLVVNVSRHSALPPMPVAVQVQVEGKPTQAALAVAVTVPLVASVLLSV